jgi:class 3 adenylate cyclase
MTAEELLLELNECFIRFDEICEAHGLEKIKVIGDSYMCVGGLPAPTPEHAQAAVAAALEMQTFIETRRLQHLQQGRPYWQMRVGIHTGPVVAGVVGKHKFSFDVWGDTVNTASRLEGAGEPGRINISTATFNKINPYYSCHYRGELTVKGKGEVGMYFVNG